MSVKELTAEQLTELKMAYYCDMAAQDGAGVSFDDLAEIDELVSDEQIFLEYESTEFCNDDFSCTASR